MRGRIHIYTGDGKGKTTAAIGLVVRYVGIGQRAAIIQMDKGFKDEEHYHERELLRRSGLVMFYAFGCERMMADGTFRFGVTDEDKVEAQKALTTVKEVLDTDRFGLIVIDEIWPSLHIGLITEQDVEGIIEHWRKHSDPELVLTGRYAPQKYIEIADLVTEMKAVKHYFEKGMKPKRGIDY